MVVLDPDLWSPADVSWMASEPPDVDSRSDLNKAVTDRGASGRAGAEPDARELGSGAEPVARELGLGFGSETVRGI